MDDLWAEASRDVEAERQDLAYYRASAALEPLWPFLALARSQPELEHRKALAMNSLKLIATQNDMPLTDIGEMINRRFALLVQANTSCPCGNDNCQCSGNCNCQEGCNCGRCHVASEVTALHKKAEEEEGGKRFDVVDKNTGAKVAGPFDDREKAQEAIEDNDSGLPSSELEIVPESTEPEEGEEDEEGKEAKRHQALTEGENILAETVSPTPGMGTPEKPDEHNEDPDGDIPADAQNKIPESVANLHRLAREARRLVHLAAEGQPPLPDGPERTEPMGEPPQGPDTPGEMTEPPTMQAETTKPRQMPDGGSPDPMQDVMSGDPVGDKVDQVTATVRQHNPTLSEATCRRVARRVVARCLTAAGDDGIDYVGGIPVKPEEEEEGHPGEAAAAGMAGRKLLQKLPLLEI